jgi:hypothetical protein
MARGHLYVITDTPNEERVSEYDMEGFVNHEFEYVEELSPEKAQAMIQEFLARFPDADVGVSNKASAIRFTQKAKEAYFQSRYEAFMKETRNLTLSDFASYYKAIDLSQLLDNNYGDAVWFWDAVESLDDFVRRINDDNTWFITQVFFMH